MSITNGKIFYINSQYRETGSNSNFNYLLNIPQTERYDRVCVLQASIPLSFYLVREGINTFSLKEAGAAKVITVPAGNYNYQKFQVMITTLLNANATAGWVYSVTFNVSTGKYQFSVTGNTVQPILTFNNYLSQQFGFDKVSVNTFSGNSIKSKNSVNFIPESTIYIHSDLCNEDTDILQEIYANNTATFAQVTYQLSVPVDVYSKKLRTTNTNMFHFWITDEDNNELDTNGQNILLTILLYKKDEFSDRVINFISYIMQYLKGDNQLQLA